MKKSDIYKAFLPHDQVFKNDEGKSSKLGNHFIFSAENPYHKDKNTLNLTHEQALDFLQQKGYKAEEMKGKYGQEERSIIVHNPPQHAIPHLMNMSASLGQDSSIVSSGQDHEMHFHHGDAAGMHVKGQGTEYHQQPPEDFYSTTQQGTHFTHNFDFDNAHPQEASKFLGKQTAEKPTMQTNDQQAAKPQADEKMQKAEPSYSKFKRGDVVQLHHGASDPKTGEKVISDKKYVVHGEAKTGRKAHWVVPEGEKDSSKGFYHRADRIHHVSDMKKSKEENPAEGMALEHYSPQQGLKSISPKFKRTGVDQGKRANDLEHDISFFYPAGTEPEPIVTGKAKSKYTAKLSPEHKVFDVEEHGREHIQAAKDKNQGVFNLDTFIGHLKEQGFHGFKTNPQGIPMVAMFDEVDVHSEEPVGGMEKSVQTPSKHIGIKRLKQIKQDHNQGAGGKEYSEEELHHAINERQSSDAERQVKHFEREERRRAKEAQMGKSESNVLAKSKNVREQKAKVFGRTSQPGAKSPMREKHMEHIKDFAQRRYGLEMKPSGGKIDEATGQRRSAEAEVGVDKPDWRSGQLEAQANPDAMVHELGHLDIMPKGVGLEHGQKYMDQQYADVQRQHGYMQQKRSQGEVQPMGVEQLLRRRAGLPANRSAVPVAGKDAPPRTAVDTGDVIGTRVQTGQTKTGDPKYGDLIRQSRFVSPENRQRVDQIDRGELKYDKERGWVKPDVSTKAGLRDNINSVINVRAREKAKDPTRKDTSTLMRSEDGEKK